MKILHVCSAATMGGGEIHVADLVVGLRERGHEVHLAVRPQSPLIERVGSAVTTVHVVPLRNSLDLLSACKLSQIIRAHGIEIIHAHLARDYLPCILAQAWSGSATLIITRHHYLPMRSNFIYRSAFKQVGKVIAVSEFVRRSMIERLRLPESRVITIPNWLPLEDYEKLPNREDARQRLGIQRRFAIGTIGKLTPAKGQEDFIRAAYLIRQRRDDCEFLIVGEEEGGRKSFKRKLDQLLRELGLTDDVRFLGYVEDVRETLAALDVFVLPSLNEAFSLVLLQAMAAGLPAIAYAVGGPTDIISDAETGFLVPCRHVELLAARIIELLDDRSLRQRFARAAKETVQRRFEREAVISRIEAVYEGTRACSL